MHDRAVLGHHDEGQLGDDDLGDALAEGLDTGGEGLLLGADHLDDHDGYDGDDHARAQARAIGRKAGVVAAAVGGIVLTATVLGEGQARSRD